MLLRQAQKGVQDAAGAAVLVVPSLARSVLGALLLALVLAASARAEPVEEFSTQIASVTVDGRFVLDFRARLYDTSGGQPPDLVTTYVRFPAGSSLAPEFLTPRYFCDAKTLLDTLRSHREGDMALTVQLANLPATLQRMSGQLDARALQNMRTCSHAQVGTGTATIDARPFLSDPIPVDLFLYLGAPAAPGALASLQSLGVPDERAPVVANNPIVKNTPVALASDFFDDPTPDGLYGMRLDLPIENPVPGIKLSVAELHATVSGLTAVRHTTTCLKRKRATCVRKKVTTTNAFWVTTPTCPPSNVLSFLVYFAYADATTHTKTAQLSCPTWGR